MLCWRKYRMKRLRSNAVAFALAAFALVFMLIGAARGEVDVLFRKATNICMECIGLG